MAIDKNNLNLSRGVFIKLVYLPLFPRNQWWLSVLCRYVCLSAFRCIDKRCSCCVKCNYKVQRYPFGVCSYSVAEESMLW